MIISILLPHLYFYYPGTVLLSIGLAPKEIPHELQGQQGQQGQQGGEVKPITQDVTPLYAGLRTDRNTDWYVTVSVLLRTMSHDRPMSTVAPECRLQYILNLS